jgi:hypothetical protein
VLKDEVLDQISSGQLSAPRIERLKNLLGVLVDGEVDDDYLKEFPNDGLHRRRALGDSVRARHRQPLSCLLAEESVRFDHPFSAVT